MAMVMEKRINKFYIISVTGLIFICTTFTSLSAKEWQFSPSLSLRETYTDNVELTIEDRESSLISQAILGLDINYQSRKAKLSLYSESSNMFYSHDNELNNNYVTLQSDADYSLWTNGPQLFAAASVSNINRSNASNGVADLVSGDTIQAENYSTGLRYNVNSSSFTLQSSLSYSLNRVEDGIGEYDGISASLNLRNSNNARISFWQIDGSFSSRNQDLSDVRRKGEQYRIEGTLGLITSFNLNPFMRFYDESFSGDLATQNRPLNSSFGPGINWLISDHLHVDLSYNFIAGDNATSEDYVSANLQWEPSARTSLKAGYSQRFFGKSYNLDFQHRTKRLSNSISYDESLVAFDRNSYEQVNIGIFWCPTGITVENISQCYAQPEAPEDGDFGLANFFSLKPVQSREFSLNKSFSWSSRLQLSRTSFSINSSASRREGIESKIVNDTLSASFEINRDISGRSKLSFSAKYDYLIFDKNNPEGSRQEDRYRTTSITYTKDLASSLSSNLTVQHVNRSSSNSLYTYDEMRAIINITKDF